MTRVAPELAASDWNGLVVLCAANGYDTTKVADQHMFEQLSKYVPVLYVDPPVSRLSALKNPALRPSLARPHLRVVGPRQARYTPVVQPFPERKGMVTLTTALVRRLLHHATSALGGEVGAVVSAWPLLPVFGCCGERVRIYWAQDDFAGLAEMRGADRSQVAEREVSVASGAQVVVASNPSVATSWASAGHDVRLVPFGCDADAYEDVDANPCADDARMPSPVVGVVGRINSRTDIEILEAVAARGHSLLLVGPLETAYEPGRIATLFRRPNVSWVGPKKFEDLPAYMKAIDVGIVPYADTVFNRGSFPLKTLEYLAAGRGVVTTDLPATRWLDTDLISVASTPRAFADAVDRALTLPRTSTLVSSRQMFARMHSWSKRAKDMADIIASKQP